MWLLMQGSILEYNREHSKQSIQYFIELVDTVSVVPDTQSVYRTKYQSSYLFLYQVACS